MAVFGRNPGSGANHTLLLSITLTPTLATRTGRFAETLALNTGRTKIEEPWVNLPNAKF